MTSKDANLHDKRTKHKPVSNTNYSFQSECVKNRMLNLRATISLFRTVVSLYSNMIWIYLYLSNGLISKVLSILKTYTEQYKHSSQRPVVQTHGFATTIFQFFDYQLTRHPTTIGIFCALNFVKDVFRKRIKKLYHFDTHSTNLPPFSYFFKKNSNWVRIWKSFISVAYYAKVARIWWWEKFKIRNVGHFQ